MQIPIELPWCAVEYPIHVPLLNVRSAEIGNTPFSLLSKIACIDQSTLLPTVLHLSSSSSYIGSPAFSIRISVATAAMPPKPRQTLKAAPSSTHSATTTSSPPSVPAGTTPRRRRWTFKPASLVLLLLLQPLCLLLGFVLLTEPCLNPSYKNSLWDKRNYLSILTTPGLIPPSEWGERFARAGVKQLFGLGVIQAWFVARLNAYVQAADREHERLVAALKTGEKKEEQKVGSFIRQLESVSLTFLGLAFAWAGVYAMLILLGAPATTQLKATATLAAHLTLILALPILHILGLPPTSSSTPSTTTTTDDSTSTTTIPNATRFYWPLLNLRPNPTFLLPLFYPLLFCIAGTLVGTAALALDWGVAWQTYPFPLLVGSLVGLGVGNFYTIFLVIFG